MQLNPYLPGSSLNQALIAAGYDPTQAAQIEENDAAIPGYGTAPGQYGTISNPSQDSLLQGYGSNIGGQLYNQQAQAGPLAANQNVLAVQPPVQAQPTSHGAITQPGYGTVPAFGALTGPQPTRSITPVATPHVVSANVALPSTAAVSNDHAISQLNAFVQQPSQSSQPVASGSPTTTQTQPQASTFAGIGQLTRPAIATYRVAFNAQSQSFNIR